MTTAVTLAEEKVWLRLPAAADTDTDAVLTSLIQAACDHVADATGLTLSCASTDTLAAAPERIKTAVKYLAGHWFENPSPDADKQAAAERVVSALIFNYRDLSYPE
jgi:hypothetical protein